MLRPLINLTPVLPSNRARSAIVVEGSRVSQALPHRLPAGHALQLEAAAARARPALPGPAAPSQESSADGSTRQVRPERCCVYCGHGLYVPPKAVKVRCPVCIREISVVDVTLQGDVQRADEIVTAGKIIVAIGARVAADLVACSVEVGGKVLGDILASQSCRVRCTAKVSGRILCRHFTLEPGAQLEGMIETIRD
jgi:hypothetical protein